MENCRLKSYVIEPLVGFDVLGLYSIAFNFAVFVALEHCARPAIANSINLYKDLIGVGPLRVAPHHVL
jgi:hypothetical protein